jgi:linoleoyl-CoA desaturase
LLSLVRSSTEFASPAVVKLALEQRVRSFMGSNRTTDSIEMYVKSVALLVAAAASYYFLIFAADSLWSAIASATILALALVGIGFNIQHDGNHGGFSRFPWVNRITGFTLDLIGASSYYWRQKHNINHHTYTNIDGEDDDIHLGWFARVCEDHQWYWFHRYQQYYLWFLYSFVHLRYVYSDWVCLYTGQMNGRAVKRPQGAQLAALIGGKAIYLGLAFVLPMTRHHWPTVVLTFLAISMLMGIIFSVVFQLAHLVDTVGHPAEKDGHQHAEWMVHQIQTTSDFATGSRFLSVALGGLNFQREHHLFPKISHVHYPALAEVVKQVCDEHRVPYAETPKLTDALRSHYRFLKQMGEQPNTSVVVAR